MRFEMGSPSAFTIWLTGLPASGKTTLGLGIKTLLTQNGVPCVLLDGDAVRMSLSSDLGFSAKERLENIRRAANVAKLLNEQGFMVICSFVSPLQHMRDTARAILGDKHFFEVFLDAPVEVCRLRDGKGNYQKAIDGLINQFTGISDTYEPPVNPDLIIDTVNLSIKESLNLLYNNIRHWQGF